MNRREASKHETRQLILRAARQLFARKGLEDCTIRDVAQRAGVSPASVMVHFKSKTALLEEALKGDIEKTLSELRATLPAGEGLLERSLYLAKGFFRLYDQNRNLYRALVRCTIFEPSGDTPGLTHLSDRYIEFLADIIEAEKSLGRIEPEVDPMVAAAAIFSLYLGALILLFRRPQMTLDDVAEALAAMTVQYLRGITMKASEA